MLTLSKIKKNFQTIAISFIQIRTRTVATGNWTLYRKHLGVRMVDSSPKTKVLGLHWNIQQDNVSCVIPPLTEIIKDRSDALSYVNSIYDVIGID